MILNALDEILFWDNIPVLKSFIKENMLKYYPDAPEKFYKEKNNFLRTKIPDKSAFISKLLHYSENGTAEWVSGRNGMSDDIDIVSMTKAIIKSSQVENGESKALQASKWQESDPDFWSYYSGNILHKESNRILELTVGAGGGTNAVMKEMSDNDYYMGADIDFICAKNADALAKYYKINGLGIATSIWNLPFENEMFTSVCSNAGLEECREIPTILDEAVRVLAPTGRIVLRCLHYEKTLWFECFAKYGFATDEAVEWLNKVRLYSDVESIKSLLLRQGMSFVSQKYEEKLGYIIIFEKPDNVHHFTNR